MAPALWRLLVTLDHLTRMSVDEDVTRTRDLYGDVPRRSSWTRILRHVQCIAQALEMSLRISSLNFSAVTHHLHATHMANDNAKWFVALAVISEDWAVGFRRWLIHIRADVRCSRAPPVWHPGCMSQRVQRHQRQCYRG